MTQKSRLVIILVVGFVLLGTLGTIRIVGQGRADDEARRVRTSAATARVSDQQVLGSMFGGEQGVADALHVDPVAVQLAQAPAGGWCANVHVRKLGATRELVFVIAADGHLTEVKDC